MHFDLPKALFFSNAVFHCGKLHWEQRVYLRAFHCTKLNFSAEVKEQESRPSITAGGT